jgi:hypothetical protein
VSGPISIAKPCQGFHAFLLVRVVAAICFSPLHDDSSLFAADKARQMIRIRESLFGAFSKTCRQRLAAGR